MADIEVQIHEAVEHRVLQEVTRQAISNTPHAMDLRTILFNVSTYLTKKDILNCRIICLEWTHVIDYILENHPSWQNLGTFNPIIREEQPAYLQVQQQLNVCRQLVPLNGGSACNPESRAIRLFGIQAFNDFCSKVARDPLNTLPFFLGRSVHLNPDTENPTEWHVYWSNAGRKIQRFSKSVRHIRMDINWFSAESRAIGSLWAVFILGRMPQVESIHIKQFQSPYHGKHYKRELNYLQHEPMPSLEKLFSLTLEVDGRGHRKLSLQMDYILTRLITECAPVLRKLVILQQGCDADLKVILGGRVFSRLRELKLKVVNGDFLNGVLDKLRAPLVDKLSVEIEKLPAGEHLISTFKRLYVKMTNLEYIQLKVNDILTDEHTLWFYTFHHFKSQVLTVDSVKTLEVHHHVFLNYHAIFRCLPNLEYLHIWGNQGDVKTKGENNFKDNKKPKGEMWFADWLFSGRLNEYVPLWTKILPNLKVVTFNMCNGPCKKYTREEYVKIMKKMEQVEMYLKKYKM